MNKWIFGLTGAAGGLTAAAAVHRGLLRKEQELLIPPGTMVEVNGRRMHVYGEGPADRTLQETCQGDAAGCRDIHSRKKVTLVFLSGGGTPAPVYDFRPLYRKLSPWYRCVVVEKAGYGYSDIDKCGRRLEGMLEETRLALRLAGEKGPFVLVPHSMSGLEALYWAQRYPAEILGIAGLDMAFPKVYDYLKTPPALMKLPGLISIFGIHRCPFFQLVKHDGLTQEEYRQARLLAGRNFMNPVIMEECCCIHANAATVREHGRPHVPFLIFCSDGKDLGKFWVPLQKKYAEKLGGEFLPFSCGHYLHYDKAAEIAEAIRAFVKKI